MKLGVFIGRFSPLHLGHEKIIRQMLEEQEKVLILFGSSNLAQSTKNPFTFEERVAMLKLAFPLEWNTGRIHATPIGDFPSDARWQYAIQEAVSVWHASTVTLYGFNKDESSYYLNIFPQWNLKECEPLLSGEKIFNATSVRYSLFEAQSGNIGEVGTKDCSSVVQDWLRLWSYSSIAEWLREEYKYEQHYLAPYKALPYPPIFQTVDNVVLWRGLVLMIQRKHRPGMGLWALPGGYLNVHETKKVGAIRELTEETSPTIFRPTKTGRVRIPVDSHWIVAQQSFDNPGRSQRGRIITEAFLWRIPDNLEVLHRAGDDAAKSKFIPLQKILDEMGSEIFEDHLSIIATMCFRF